MKIKEHKSKYTYTSNTEETVRPALISLFNSTNFEDAIRNAISFGRDTDTITTIISNFAETYYKKIPEQIKIKASMYLPKEFTELLNRFNKEITRNKYRCNITL